MVPRVHLWSLLWLALVLVGLAIGDVTIEHGVYLGDCCASGCSGSPVLELPATSVPSVDCAHYDQLNGLTGCNDQGVETANGACCSYIVPLPPFGSVSGSLQTNCVQSNTSTSIGDITPEVPESTCTAMKTAALAQCRADSTNVLGWTCYTTEPDATCCLAMQILELSGCEDTSLDYGLAGLTLHCGSNAPATAQDFYDAHCTDDTLSTCGLMQATVNAFCLGSDDCPTYGSPTTACCSAVQAHSWANLDCQLTGSGGGCASANIDMDRLLSSCTGTGTGTGSTEGGDYPEGRISSMGGSVRNDGSTSDNTGVIVGSAVVGVGAVAVAGAAGVFVLRRKRSRVLPTANVVTASPA